MLHCNTERLLNVDECYSELGLRPDCSDAEIKAAWRRLAARWHPDRNDSPQALRKIQRINRALEEIRNARDTMPADVEDEPAPPAARPPREHRVELALEEAFAGCTRTLQGELVDDCADCAGTGVEPHATSCHECGGSGRARQQLWFGWMAPARCKACQGEGVARHACPHCEGSGQAAPLKYRCRVQVPAGTRDGDVLRVSVRMQGPGGKRSETLQVRIVLQPHDFFTLEADGTVRCELPVDGFAWMAERWIEVPTPGGPQQMRLKRGYLGYRIKGQGWPGPGGERADCMVTVEPQFPQEFSSRQAALVDQLVAANADAPRLAQWRQRVAAWQAGLPR